MNEMQMLIDRLDRIEILLREKDDILSVRQAAEFLDLTASGVYRLISERRIPVYKPNNKRSYFLRSELLSWLKQNRAATEDELQQHAVDQRHKQTTQSTQTKCHSITRGSK